MKTLEEFAQLVKEKFEERYPEHRIVLQNVTKETGTRLGLVITAPGSNIGATLYMDAPYAIYKEKGNLESILAKMVDTYESAKPTHSFDVSLFTKENIMVKVMPRLVRRTENTDKYFHYDVLNSLSMIYYLPVIVNGGDGAIKLTPEHIEKLGIDVNEMHAAAMRHMIPNYDLADMNATMREMNPELWEQVKDAIRPGYILSNKEKHHGACQMFNVNVLNDILGTWKTDTIYIVPSSIHELLIRTKEEVEQDIDEYRKMIGDVNDTQLEEEDILSYDLYKYTRKYGLEIV